tara:strand:- start:1167 stop:1586 length:420 start_codon:yes stop_codon:yes gene_type:complete
LEEEISKMRKGYKEFDRITRSGIDDLVENPEDFENVGVGMIVEASKHLLNLRMILQNTNIGYDGMGVESHVSNGNYLKATNRLLELNGSYLTHVNYKPSKSREVPRFWGLFGDFFGTKIEKTPMELSGNFYKEKVEKVE